MIQETCRINIPSVQFNPVSSYFRTLISSIPLLRTSVLSVDMPGSIDQILHTTRRDIPPKTNDANTNHSSSSVNRTLPLTQMQKSGRPTSPSGGNGRNLSLNHRRNDIKENNETFIESDNSMNGSAGSYGSNITDFFGSDIFQIVIHNPTTAYRFLRFCQSRNCGESMEFLQKVCLDYHKTLCTVY